MEDNGVKVILHCYVVDVILENKKILGVITESKSGRKAITAKRVIDCTGDGDVAYLSGAEYKQKDVKDRLGVTTVFNCSGVDKEKFMNYVNNDPKKYKDWESGWGGVADKERNLNTPYFEKEFKKAEEKGIIEKDSNISGTWSSLTDAGEATNLNLCHIKNIDTTNVLDLTKAEIEGRKKSMEIIKALKETVPGFEKAKLRNFGMTLGTRDSRKITCIYNLTKDDVLNQGRFHDSIGIFPEFIDGYNVLVLPVSGRYYQIPLRALIPIEIDNLSIAGRAVGGDEISHASLRNMMACTVTGQGAGVACAISVKKNKILRHVNILDVQKELKKQNVKLDNIVSKL